MLEALLQQPLPSYFLLVGVALAWLEQWVLGWFVLLQLGCLEDSGKSFLTRKSLVRSMALSTRAWLCECASLMLLRKECDLSLWFR